MSTLYSELPDNLNEISSFLKTDFAECKTLIEEAGLVIFYDASSVQHHSVLSELVQTKICRYIKSNNGLVVLTKCILMELAGERHTLHEGVVSFLTRIAESDIQLLLFEESWTFEYLTDMGMSTSQANQVLHYAVRKFKSPGSTILECIKNHEALKALVAEGKVPNKKDLCKRFFYTARQNKQPQDNLGEDLIGICLYMLMHLTAQPSHKFTVFTDDKFAARVILNSIKSIPSDITDKRPGIFSSIKLFQTLYTEENSLTKEELKESIKRLYSDEVRVLALMEKSDLETNLYRFTAQALTNLIAEKGVIKITF